MPILHVQQEGQTQTPDGRLIQLAPSTALLQKGPCIQVMVTVAQGIVEQLLMQGMPVPPPISGIALIDTGASSTCVDETVAQQLGLPVVDVVQIASASQVAAYQNVYPAQIELVGIAMTIDAPRAIGAPLAAMGIIALIGRDFLQQCALFYNGLSGEITLSI